MVAGVQTGRDISAASENLPLDTAIWNRAVPAFTVETGNRAPIGESFEVVIPEGTPVQITLRATDADGDALTWRIAGQPTFGTMTGAGPTPIVTYTPRAGFTGLDTFSFEANDGKIAE